MRVGQTRKRDANEPEIVSALRAVGATVFQLSGAGVPDLLVGYRGQWTPLEVKSETGQRTPLQRAHPVLIVRSVREALRAVRAMARP